MTTIRVQKDRECPWSTLRSRAFKARRGGRWLVSTALDLGGAIASGTCAAQRQAPRVHAIGGITGSENGRLQSRGHQRSESARPEFDRFSARSGCWLVWSRGCAGLQACVARSQLSHRSSQPPWSSACMTKHDRKTSQDGVQTSLFAKMETWRNLRWMNNYACFVRNWQSGGPGFDSLHPLHKNSAGLYHRKLRAFSISDQVAPMRPEGVNCFSYRDESGAEDQTSTK